MKFLSPFLIGLLFGIGLVVSGMVNPQKIIGFLDISGEWDPTLLVVMASALMTTFVGYRLVLARPRPAMAPEFQIPTKTEIDRALLIGAGIFGIGWGMAGLCPGPGFSALLVGGLPPILFIGAMVAGMALRPLVKV